MKTKQILLTTILVAQMISLLHFYGFGLDLMSLLNRGKKLTRHTFSHHSKSSITREISDDVPTEIDIRYTSRKWTWFKGQNISTEFEQFYNVSTEYLQNPLVNKHEYLLSLNNENLCAGKQIFIVSFVHSAPLNFEERQIIRASWGSFHKYKNKYFQHVFLLGQISNTTIQERLKKESNIHGDLVQGNFMDSYRNMTFKQVLGLYWIIKFCGHAQFVIKIDDDVIVNIPLVTEFLLKRANSTGTSGFMQCQYYITDHPERSVRSKWFTSINEYSPARFPPYCIGLAYLMSADVVYKFLEASKKVPFFWVDDVYVGGFLPWVTGVEMHRTKHFYSSARTMKDLPFRLTSLFYLYYNRTLFRQKWRFTWKRILAHTRKHLLHELTISLPVASFIGFV